MMNYDGFDTKSYLTVTEIKRPVLPPQKLSTKTINGRPGAYFFRKQHEPVVLPVSIAVKGKSHPDFRKRVRFLSRKFNKNEPKRIIFSDEPEMYIKGIVEDSTELEKTFLIGKGDINFYCPDPFYYAVEDETATYDSEGEYTFTREKGNDISFPLIEIEGRNDSGEIGIKTDDVKITFDGKLKEDEILVLDSHLITCYIKESDGGKRSGNNDIDKMDFPVLDIDDNLIDFSVSGGATIEKIKVYARSRWT